MSRFASLEDMYKLPSGLLDAVAHTESNYNPRAVNPKSGAAGMFQFMPATAKQYGIDPFDPAQAADGAARMFRDLLKMTGGDVKKALAGYNWGIGNVQRKGMDNMPEETKNYIPKVESRMSTTGSSMMPRTKNTDEYDSFPGAKSSQKDDEYASFPVSATEKPSKPSIDRDPFKMADQRNNANANMSASDEYLAGAGRKMVAAGQAVRQMSDYTPMGWLYDKARGAMGVDVAAETKKRDAEIQDQARLYQYLANNSSLARAGEVLGDVAVTSPLMAVGAPAAGASKLANLGKMGAFFGGQGAAASVMNPITDPNADFVAEKSAQAGKGAAIGLAIGGGLAGAGAIAKPIANMFRGKDARIGSELTDILTGSNATAAQKQAAIEALDAIKNQQNIPGSQMSLAGLARVNENALPAGAVQRLGAASNFRRNQSIDSSAAFKLREEQNQAALVGALEKLGVTGKSADELQKAAQQAGVVFGDDLARITSKLDDSIRNLPPGQYADEIGEAIRKPVLDRMSKLEAVRKAETQPFMDDAMAQGAVVDLKGVRDFISSRIGADELRGVASQTLQKLLDKIDKVKKVIPGDRASKAASESWVVTPKQAHDLRKELGDILRIQSPVETGGVRFSGGEVKAVQEALDGVIETASPALKQYIAKFRELSKPINAIEESPYLGKIIETDEFRKLVAQTENIVGQIVKTGPKGRVALQEYKATGGDLEPVKDYIYSEIQRLAKNDRTGEVLPGAVASWVKQHQPLLSEMPKQFVNSLTRPAELKKALGIIEGKNAAFGQSTLGQISKGNAQDVVASALTGKNSLAVADELAAINRPAAKGSILQDVMETAKDGGKRVKTSSGVDVPQLSPARLLSALDDNASVIGKLTNNADKAQLKKLTRDALAQTAANKSGVVGPGTQPGQKMLADETGVVTDVIQKAGIAGRTANVAMKWFDKLGGAERQRILTEAMLNPQIAAALMKKGAQNNTAAAIDAIYRSSLGPGKMAITQSALSAAQQPALSPEEVRQQLRMYQ